MFYLYIIQQWIDRIVYYLKTIEIFLAITYLSASKQRYQLYRYYEEVLRVRHRRNGYPNKYMYKVLSLQVAINYKERRIILQLIPMCFNQLSRVLTQIRVFRDAILS